MVRGYVVEASARHALLRNIDEINKLQQDAVAAVEDLQTGKRTDVEGVMIATAKAQRQSVSIIGLIWPTASLPATAFPPQHNVAITRHR